MSPVVLGLDVGSKRVGLAMGTTTVAIAHPLVTLENNDSFFRQLQAVVTEHDITELVVGLPRGLDGQETEQTAFVHRFVEQLQSVIALPVHLQDEAVTSVQAEAELQARRKPYTKGDIDALAATYILQDYLDSEREAKRSKAL